MNQNKLGGISFGLLLSLFSASLFIQPKSFLEEDGNIEQLVQQQENQEIQEDVPVVEDDLTTTLVKEVIERIENQEKVDSMIQAEVESGYYTVENPLVILDPYNQSPLTALICFTTEIPTQVHIHIEGEDEYTEVNHTFGELVTQHVIPVYGLYADKLNPVTITVINETWEVVTENLIEIQTEPVSDHYQNLIILTETFEEGYQEGINFLYQNGKMAFDKEGDIRWYFTKIDYLFGSDYEFYNNHFMTALGTGHENSGDVFFYELDKLGKIYSFFYSFYGTHHDISVTDRASFLTLGANPESETTQDYIYEVDYLTGEIIHSLDMKNILQRNRPAWDSGSSSGVTNQKDWLHINSIVFSETDNAVIISSNYQSCVVKMNWPTGDIQWIMGNHDDWNPRMQQFLLEPIGADFEWHYNQHDAMILPDYDDNQNTVDILLFDNGSSRFNQDAELQRKISNNEIVEPELYSRLVHYRIDEETMEVEQIWQYGKERGLSLFSTWRSGVALLNNGNVLGMFEHYIGSTAHPIVTEVTKDSKLIWEAELFRSTENGHKFEYRAERLPFYFDDDGEHDIYTTARNLIPQEIMDSVFGTEITLDEIEGDYDEAN